jgi:hypothetical protein
MPQLVPVISGLQVVHIPGTSVAMLPVPGNYVTKYLFVVVT